MKRVKRRRKRKLNKKAKLVLFIIFILIIVVAVYFINDKDVEIPKIKKNKTKVEKIEKKVQIIDESSTSRPYAIMINNVGVARPLQSGLQDAYIVYEIIVEGGITRFLAVFRR